VREGRLEPVGGMWVEPDCNMLGGESLVRQLLHGQRYFGSRFGRHSTVAWLPDTFGFSPALPQLLLEAGIEGFFTTKLSWNETTRFPHDLWWWEGLDGSRVLAHSFFNPAMRAYNGLVRPNDLLNTYRAYKGRHLPVWGEAGPESLFTFGWGDGGGGPTDEMLEMYARLKDFPALPKLRMARVEEFFAELPREGLPVWSGELYLEYHRGTLTSQGRTKRLHRRAEHRLVEAETLAALAHLRGHPYPAAGLEATWKTLLLNQFHDILPGSSIREVYESTEPELEGVVAAATAARDEALRRLAGEGGEEGWWTVANPSLAARPLEVVLPVPAGTAHDPTGRPLPTQPAEGGLLVRATGSNVPALGLTSLRLGPGPAPPVEEGVTVRHEGGGFRLQNDKLTVVVGPDGALHRVYDRELGREVLAGRGNRLVAHFDLPGHYEAWDVNPDVGARARRSAAWRGSRASRRAPYARPSGCAAAGAAPRSSRSTGCERARAGSTSGPGSTGTSGAAW
jgi:alpha-mannosidase